MLGTIIDLIVMNFIEQILPKLMYEQIFEFKLWELFDPIKLYDFVKNLLIQSVHSIIN